MSKEEWKFSNSDNDEQFWFRLWANGKPSLLRRFFNRLKRVPDYKIISCEDLINNH